MSQADDARKITDLTREWRQSAERGELDTHISFLADDGVVLYPGGGVMEPAALRTYEEVIHRYMSVYETLDLQTPVISGDFAYNWGTAETIRDGRDGRPTHRKIRTYLLIWHRQSSGEWKLKVVMYNEAAPEEMELPDIAAYSATGEGEAHFKDQDNLAQLVESSESEKLSLAFEKILLASEADRETRIELVHDKNRAVWTVALLKMNQEDAELISEMRDVLPDVLREIARDPAWSRVYGVCLNLVMNPVTPEDVALALLPQLSNDDLKRVSDDSELSEPVREAAHGLRRRGCG